MAKPSTKSEEAKLRQTRGNDGSSQATRRARKHPPKPPPPKDAVEEADRYNHTTMVGELEAHSLKAKKSIAELRDILKPHTPSMIAVMVEIAENEKVHPSVRLEAASRVLDRAYGKPREHMLIDMEPAEQLGESDEMLKLLNGIFEKLGVPKIEPPTT